MRKVLHMQRDHLEKRADKHTRKRKNSISERKMAKEALKQSEEQLRLITDNVPAMISYVDLEQRYRFAK